MRLDTYTYEGAGDTVSCGRRLDDSNLRFPGQYFDKETNLHYNYFRDYDPAIGCYIQSDPIGLAGGINTYLYATDPLTQTDPMGLMGRGGAQTRGGYWKQTEPPGATGVGRRKRAMELAVFSKEGRRLLVAIQGRRLCATTFS